MVVRIRFNYHRALQQTDAINRQAAILTSTLLTPVSVMAFVLGFWRLAADLNWAGSFAIPSGIFSHWQVWFAIGIAVQFFAFLLHRFAAAPAK